MRSTSSLRKPAIMISPALQDQDQQIAHQKRPKRLTEPDVGNEILDSLRMRSRGRRVSRPAVAEIQHLDSATAERLGETVVLLLRTVDPGQPIESRASLLRGVNRLSSLPGRCSSTVRNRPTSERTPGTVTASTDMTVRLPIRERPRHATLPD